MKKYFIIITTLVISSCASKKTTIETIRVERDSIYITKIIKEIEAFRDTLTIENPCDSITGNLKPFKQLISTKQGKVSLQGKNNVITAEIDLNAYKEVLEKEYKSKLDKNIVIKEKEVIRYRTPLWVWLVIILESLIIALLLKNRFF